MESIIDLAFGMTEAVGRLKDRVKQFYYAVALSGHRCPRCNGSQEMSADSQARCIGCGNTIDPTVEYQRCACGGRLELVIRRYQCRQCGADIQSRFLFDGLAFDAEYFRQKMVESRQRKQAKREQVRQMLAESRLGWTDVPPVDPHAMSGLVDALNALTQESEAELQPDPGARFELKRYQSHIQAQLRSFPIRLVDMPPLSEHARKDLIWRFIAILFLAHARIVDIWQEGREIMVRKNETNTEGQGVPGDAEAADGFEGVVDRAAA